jgi:hypothetical protein
MPRVCGTSQAASDVPADADPTRDRRPAAQQGIVFMGRTGIDIATLTATALTARRLPDA